MGHFSMVGSTVFTVLVSVFASSAFAQWELDGDNSALQFISTKNAAVAESHSFGSLSGSINDGGAVQVEIALDSVETLIDIRNQRMREMLFETARFPLATVMAQVDEALLNTAAGGGVVATEVPVTLSLHGSQKNLVVPVVMVGTPAGGLLVVTARPILINAADFGLSGGVSLLQQAAGLKSISTAVPVTFKLLFAPAS